MEISYVFSHLESSHPSLRLLDIEASMTDARKEVKRLRKEADPHDLVEEEVDGYACATCPVAFPMLSDLHEHCRQINNACEPPSHGRIGIIYRTKGGGFVGRRALRIKPDVEIVHGEKDGETLHKKSDNVSGESCKDSREGAKIGASGQEAGHSVHKLIQAETDGQELLKNQNEGQHEEEGKQQPPSSEQKEAEAEHMMDVNDTDVVCQKEAATMPEPLQEKTRLSVVVSVLNGFHCSECQCGFLSKRLLLEHACPCEAKEEEHAKDLSTLQQQTESDDDSHSDDEVDPSSTPATQRKYLSTLQQQSQSDDDCRGSNDEVDPSSTPATQTSESTCSSAGSDAEYYPSRRNHRKRHSSSIDDSQRKVQKRGIAEGAMDVYAKTESGFCSATVKEEPGGKDHSSSVSLCAISTAKSDKYPALAFASPAATLDDDSANETNNHANEPKTLCSVDAPVEPDATAARAGHPAAADHDVVYLSDSDLPNIMYI